MHRIFTLFFSLLSFITVYCQQGLSITCKEGGVMRIHCVGTLKTTPPVFVVDGIVRDEDWIKKMNVGDILRVDILKDDSAAAIYGCTGPPRGVVIITTTNQQRFAVLDFLDGTGLAGASLVFRSNTDSARSVTLVADDSGFVHTTELAKEEAYSVVVSSAGYKTATFRYMNSGEQTVNDFVLERNVVMNGNVTVVGYPPIRCRRRVCCLLIGIRITPDQTSNTAPNIAARAYPNPVVRGASLGLEINTPVDQFLDIRIATLSGQSLSRTNQQFVKGMTRISVPTSANWTPGIYLVQLMNREGKQLSQYKILIR